jgi:hypothetical protein
LRRAKKIRGDPEIGYYWIDGVEHFGERHPYYGKFFKHQD